MTKTDNELRNQNQASRPQESSSVPSQEPEGNGSAASITEPRIFDYQDYRLFLKDTLSARRAKNKKMNMQKLAAVIGFSSHAGLAMILNGQRELRPPYLDRCIRWLGLDVKQRLYFEALVRSGQLTPAKRRSLLREVLFLSERWEPPALEEGIHLLEFGLVHQILCMNKRMMSADEIANQFRFKIDVRRVEKILAFMLRNDQVISELGRFRVRKDVIILPDEILAVSGQQMHIDCLKLAAEALADPLEKREFQSFIFSIEKRRLNEMKQRIKKLVMEVVSEFESDIDADTVVQLHFNMFEAIKPKGEL